MTRPPRLAEWLMRRSLVARDRSVVLDDMREEFQERARHSARAARVWYWREVVRSLGPNVRRLLTDSDRRLRHPTSWSALLGLSQDVRVAWRSLRTSPSTTVVALVVLTLGIGALTAVFSVVDAVLLRPLPYWKPEDLVAVRQMPRGDAGSRRFYASSSVAPQDYLDWSARQDVFDGIAATSSGTAVDVEGSELVPLLVDRVTPNFFDVLRRYPRIGHDFGSDADVDRDPQIAIISDTFWRRRFGAAPDVVGQRLVLQTGTFRIVGVMPPDFADPFSSSSFSEVFAAPADLWLPYRVPAAERVRAAGNTSMYLKPIARLRPGVTVAQARSRMENLSAAIVASDPGWYASNGFGGHAAVFPMADWTVSGNARSWIWLLFGAASIVLLVACVNVANLLLARATSRTHELTIRAALGASRWRLARGLLVESLLLSLAGTVLAALAAYWLVALLKAGLPPDVPKAALIAVNSRVLLVTATIAVTAGLAIGLVPAFASSGRSFMQGLRAGGSRSGTASTTRQRIRSALVVGEVALAVALVVGAGLLSASFVRLISVDLGLDYRGVLTMSVTPVVTGATQPLRTAAGIRAMEDVLQRIRALPGVTEAGALAGALPFSGNTSRVGVSVAGRGDFKGDDASDRYFVTPDYLTVMRLPLLRGRLFTESDDRTDAEPVVLLSQTAARRYFGDADALGETVNMTGNRRVVGIVADMRPLGPESPARPEAYAPLAQGDRPFGSIVVRCNQASPALSAQIRSVVAGVMPQRVVPQPVLLDDLFAPIIASRRFNMLLVGLFGVLALAIAAAGLYGVVSYLVTQRTQEIGVRIALGAAPARVVRMVLGRALTLVTVGVAFGLMLAWAEGGVLRSFLFQVSPHDARVYAGVAAVLLIVGLGAAYVPARRAAKVDPLVALRHD